MKKKRILIKVLLLIILNILILEKCTYASVTGDIWGTISGGWGYWLNKQGSTMMDINMSIGTTSAISETKDYTENILGVFQVVGSVASVIALLVIGFRYMFSSVEEKAEVKGVMIYYVIGCILVFATSNILSVVYNVISGMNG